MSDSGSSTAGEARMLERRVSNNRGDLSSDGQMNYFLSWFSSWSELQRSDFVPVLAGKMSKSDAHHHDKGVNGIADKFKSMDCNSSRPPTLFSCQVKLFHDWFNCWSDDQKNYLVLRLQDIDPGFFAKYEKKVSSNDPDSPDEEKDYFEPGIPTELIRNPTKLTDEDESDLKKHNNNVSSTSSSLSPISEQGC